MSQHDNMPDLQTQVEGGTGYRPTMNDNAIINKFETGTTVPNHASLVRLMKLAYASGIVIVIAYAVMFIGLAIKYG